jgi:outer membrane immunogenic protein
MRKMNYGLVGFTALAMFSAGQAQAQSAETPFNWSGPYVGLNAGYVIDGKTRFDRTTGDLPNNQAALDNNLRPTQQTVDGKGFTGGAQAGYNYALGAGNGLVIGAEADLSYVDLSDTDTLSNTTNFGGGVTPSPTPVTRVNEYRAKLGYLGTLRGRVGYAFDRVMVYGTGGLAFGKVKRSTTFFGPNLPTTPFFTGSDSSTKVGYAVGGGVEFALPTQASANLAGSSAVTLRAEYLHFDLGRDKLRLDGVNGGATIGGYDSRVRTSGNLVRAAINYKF